MRSPHHGRGGSRHIGRVRVAAAKIISDSLGMDVLPEDIVPASGRYRTDWRMDTFRWELQTPSAWAGCWETLTSFVKASRRLGGCHISGGEIWPGKAKPE